MVYRLDVSTAAATPPTAGTAGTEGFPTAGSPPSVPPATIDPYFVYALCEEIRNAVVAAGLTPAKANVTQLLQTLKRFAGGNVTTVTATQALTADNAGVVFVNATAGNVTITLPAAAVASGIPLPYIFVRTDSSANVVNVVTAGTDTYLPGGGATLVLAANSVVSMLGDGVAGYLTINTITGSNQIFSAIVTKAASYTLTSANNGNLVLVNGTYTQTLPATAGISAGYSCMIENIAGVTTINTNGGTVQLASGAVNTSFTLPSVTDFVWLEWEGTYWRVLGGSAAILGALKASNNLSDVASLATALTNLSFASDSATYFKIPNPNNPTKPWIVQFGTQTLASANTSYTYTFPIAFPTAIVAFVTSAKSITTPTGTAIGSVLSLTQYSLSQATGGIQQFWIAVGN